MPILGGGRLTGKVGDFSVGAINIQTDDTPGAGAVPTNFSVLRVKRDVLRRSRIGAIFTNRSVSLTEDGANQAYGVDGAFSFYDDVNLYGYYARTNTPGLEGRNESYQAAFSYDDDLYGLLVDHLLVGRNFNPEVGFMRRKDFRRTFVSGQFSPRPAGLAAVRQFTWGGSVDYIENGAGQLETRILQGTLSDRLREQRQPERGHPARLRVSRPALRHYRRRDHPRRRLRVPGLPGVLPHGTAPPAGGRPVAAARRVLRRRHHRGRLLARPHRGLAAVRGGAEHLVESDHAAAGAGSRPAWPPRGSPTPSRRACSPARCCSTARPTTC